MVEVGVAVIVMPGGAELVASAGQLSPGLSMKEEFSASCLWIARETLALGLITPTMPQLWNWSTSSRAGDGKGLLDTSARSTAVVKNRIGVVDLNGPCWRIL